MKVMKGCLILDLPLTFLLLIFILCKRLQTNGHMNVIVESILFV